MPYEIPYKLSNDWTVFDKTSKVGYIGLKVKRTISKSIKKKCKSLFLMEHLECV